MLILDDKLEMYKSTYNQETVPVKKTPVTVQTKENSTEGPTQKTLPLEPLRTVICESGYFDSNGTGVSSFQGTRGEQQDRYKIISVSSDYARFLKSRKLLDTFCDALEKKLEEKLPKESIHSGACFSLTFNYKTPLLSEKTICSVGDCRDFYYDPTEKSGNRLKLLNVLHTPIDTDERDRVEKAGGVIKKGRIKKENRSIAVTRAFGDQYYNVENTKDNISKKVIISSPDVKTYSHEPDKNKGAFHCKSSDGLSDPFKSLQDLESFFDKTVKQYNNSTSKTKLPLATEISKQLIMNAYLKAMKNIGKCDNTTAIITPSALSNTKETEKSVQLSIDVVIDGHGEEGHIIADFLKDNFLPVLGETLMSKETKEKDKQQKNHAEEIISILGKLNSSDLKKLAVSKQENGDFSKLPINIQTLYNTFQKLYISLTENVNYEKDKINLSNDFLAVLPEKITYSERFKNNLAGISDFFENHKLVEQTSWQQFCHAITSRSSKKDLLQQATELFSSFPGFKWCLWENNKPGKENVNPPQIQTSPTLKIP